MRILAVIPCYNEEKNIVKTVENIKKEKIDYVVINDGSKDRSLEVLKNNKINHINLNNNVGIGGVMQTGYKYALYNNYDIVVQFDGDGQHDASYINKITKPIIEKKANLVIGSRFVGEESEFKSTKMRRLGINLYKELASDTFTILGAGGAYLKCSNYKLFLEHNVPSSVLVPPHYNYDLILKGHSHFFKFKENRNVFRVASCSNLQPNSYSFGFYAPGFATLSTTDGLVIEGYNFIKDETVHTLTLKIKD